MIDLLFRDWSLITGRGGGTKREGGAHEVLPLRKGGTETKINHAEGGGGGHNKFWGSEFLHCSLKF